jgi:acyl dehydratase
MSDANPEVANLLARVGEEIGVSGWIEISQERINQFADTTNDHQWIHVDIERAKRESPVGTTIAHGFLTLSLLAPTAGEVLTGPLKIRQALNYGLGKVRFLAPVKSGARVRNRIKLLSVEDKGSGRYLVTSENSMEIEGESKPAFIAEALVMLMF